MTAATVQSEAAISLLHHQVASNVRAERVIGKGGLDATIPLHPVIAAEAAAYPRIGWWFPSHDRPGESLLPRSVSRTVSDAMHRAGVPASGHALRHWHGTEILRASGGALRIAQEALRHQSPATTAIYTKVDDAEQRAALEALPMPIYGVGPRGPAKARARRLTLS